MGKLVPLKLSLDSKQQVLMHSCYTVAALLDRSQPELTSNFWDRLSGTACISKHRDAKHKLCAEDMLHALLC